LQKRGQIQLAEEAFQDALAIQEKLTSEFPDRLVYREFYGGSLNDLGTLYAATDRPEEAAKVYRQARDHFQALVGQRSEAETYRQKLAATSNNLGNALRVLGRAGDAEKALRAALLLWEKLAADYPATLSHRQEMAATHNNLAVTMAADTQRLADAEKEYGEAVAILEKLAADFPPVPVFRSSLAATLDNLGRILSRQGKSIKAREKFDRAGALHLAVTREKPDNAPFRSFLRNHYAMLAEALLRPGDKGDKPRYADAAAAAEELPRLYPKVANEYFLAATVVARCVPLARQDAGAAAAKKYADRALQLLEEAVKHGYKDASLLRSTTAFAAIADRADFKSLLAGLE
jgi:tetratricopeptide (TPR) repeat protein